MTFIQLLLIVLQLPWKYCRVPLIYPPIIYTVGKLQIIEMQEKETTLQCEHQYKN